MLIEANIRFSLGKLFSIQILKQTSNVLAVSCRRNLESVIMYSLPLSGLVVIIGKICFHPNLWVPYENVCRTIKRNLLVTVTCEKTHRHLLTM